MYGSAAEIRCRIQCLPTRRTGSTIVPGGVNRHIVIMKTRTTTTTATVPYFKSAVFKSKAFRFFF